MLRLLKKLTKSDLDPDLNIKDSEVWFAFWTFLLVAGQSNTFTYRNSNSNSNRKVIASAMDKLFTFFDTPVNP